MNLGTTSEQTIRAAAALARQRLLARGFTLPEAKGETPDDLAEQARRENAIRMGMRAVELSAQGGYAQYARRHLRVRGTDGRIVPFHFNDAQVQLHQVIVQQLVDLGRVRVIVLKARQLGISTYFAGRDYYGPSRRTGQSAIIIAHEKATSAGIYGMVRTFHDFIDPRFRPHTARANAGEMYFDVLRSRISIATAKNVSSGRGLTAQIFHGSECSRWPNASELIAGAMQGVHDVPNTEVCFESTAVGPTGAFYTSCQAARKGELGDFRFVFLPWFILPERVRTPPPDLLDTMTAEDREYMTLHGLTLPQMAWRANKIREIEKLSGSDHETARVIFMQEFPATPEDAFSAHSEGSFIAAAPVIRARRAYREGIVVVNPAAPKILGVDPSWMGNDKFRIWSRQGRIARRVGGWKHQTITSSVGRLLGIIETERPDWMCVDAVGVGAGVYDLLVEVLQSKQMPGIVFCIMAGATALDEERYVLVRDECWGRMKDWLTNPPQVAIEDDDAIQADLTSVRNKGDMHRRVRLESKDEMRKPPRNLPSPDDGDALSLTFAMSDIGTIGRAGTRSAGLPDPNRPFNYKIGG